MCLHSVTPMQGAPFVLGVVLNSLKLMVLIFNIHSINFSMQRLLNCMLGCVSTFDEAVELPRLRVLGMKQLALLQWPLVCLTVP